MRLKRYFKAIIVGLAFSLLIIGCTWGSYITTDSIENNTSSSMSMKYGTFKGYKCTNVNLKSGDILKLSIDIKTKSGYLDVYLLNKDNDEIYRLENPQESVEEEIEIEKDGKYIIKVDGNHSGSYDIKWKVS